MGEVLSICAGERTPERKTKEVVQPQLFSMGSYQDSMTEETQKLNRLARKKTSIAKGEYDECYIFETPRQARKRVLEAA